MITAILLAAGQSSRMAPHHKLLLRNTAGTTMVAACADTLLAAGLPVLVVLGHQAQAVRAALHPRPVTFTLNPAYAQGMATSLRAGLAALPAETHAALIALADMPWLPPETIKSLATAWRPGRILVPTASGRRGNPVLWDRSFFPDMMTLSGDTGARALLARHAAHVTELETQTAGVLQDADTPDALHGEWQTI